MTDLFFDTALLPDGWARDVRVTVTDGRIAAVETAAARQPRDEAYGAAIPGLPNLHSHAFQRGMAGLAERRGGAATDSFWTWRDLMYRFANTMSPEQMEAIAVQAYAEMLEAGFTRVGEFHYVHHDTDGTPYADLAELAGRIAAAAARTGIGLTLLPVLYAHAGFGGQAPAEGQRRFINDADRFARLLEGCRRHAGRIDGAVVGVAPHSLRAVTPQELTDAVALAGGGPIHIHIAEQVSEVEDCLAWSGQRPVDWLLDHASVDARWCLIHATHMTDGEVGRMATSRAVAGLCPITEANLGDGIFPGAAFAAAGGAIGVGTDSNVLIDAAGELRQLEYSQRLGLRARNVLAASAETSTGRTLFDACLKGGAQALGVQDMEIAVGAPADLVALRQDDAGLAGRRGDALLDTWIFAAPRGAVDTVWVRGRQMVKEGRHVEAGAIAARFRRTVEELLAA